MTEDQESFIEKVQEGFSLLENFGGWNRDMLKAIYGGKRDNNGLMNRVRHKMNDLEADPTPARFHTLWRVTREECDYIEQLRDELQEKHDNTPESLQGSDAYSNRDEALMVLDDAKDLIEEAIDFYAEEVWTKSVKEQQEASETVIERVVRLTKDADKQYDLGILTTEQWKARKLEIANLIPKDNA